MLTSPEKAPSSPTSPLAIQTQRPDFEQDHDASSFAQDYRQKILDQQQINYIIFALSSAHYYISG
jgi:hypothetical protein